ncbi:MAG: substrate-binding domain-containing protein [Nitrospirae bacterium]|nr:substrate-binding domain-containing protein [Nitrospirota bacterium]MBI4847245.1 substrate-binding domain-containing protein [Nitrospirota bacterium]
MRCCKKVVANPGKIKFRQLIIFASTVVLCLLLMSICLYAEDLNGTIRVGGTGNALGSFRDLGDAFHKLHPGVTVVVLPSLGSSGGIKAVNEGALDLGLSARQLKDSERIYGAIAVELARTPFVFVFSGKSGAINLTLKNIAKMYAGETKNWPNGTPIRIILRPESDADTVLMKSMSVEMKEAVQKAMSREGLTMATTDQDCADALEKVPGSFGAATVGQIISEKRAFNIVTLDGVMPSMKNFADGKYSYYKPLFLVKGPRSSPATNNFIEFINSEEGMAILKKTGFIALSGK